MDDQQMCLPSFPARMSQSVALEEADTTFEATVFPSILFTTVTGKEQGFSGLDLNGTHERRQDRGMQELGHRVAGNLQSSSFFKLCCL